MVFVPCYVALVPCSTRVGTRDPVLTERMLLPAFIYLLWDAAGTPADGGQVSAPFCSILLRIACTDLYPPTHSPGTNQLNIVLHTRTYSLYEAWSRAVLSSIDLRSIIYAFARY